MVLWGLENTLHASDLGENLDEQAPSLQYVYSYLWQLQVDILQVYFLAWIFDLIVPMLAITIMVLIVFPKTRHVMFPPVPLALVSSSTGGIQKPKAGVLGSTDSATGAPEKHKGEAVEQEASNFIKGITHVAIASAAGVHEQADPEPEGDIISAEVPDPTKMALAAADSKGSAEGGAPAHHDKTKQPMEDAIWKQMRPIMRILNNIADMWERFGNALSPTPPFPHSPRYRLAALVVPLLLVSLITTSYMFMKANEFIIGAAFFSDPLMQRGIKILNEKIPDWPKYLEIRNTILKGVPTNAQLTITLLRIGEANRAPLPPPPTSNQPPPNKSVEVDKQAITDAGLDASHSDIDEAVKVEAPSNSEATTNEQQAKPKKKGAGARIVGFFKGTTAGAIETKLKTDAVAAAVGSSKAKDHLGILPKRGSKKRIEGPIEFKGRYKGRRGAVYIDSSVSPPSKSTGQVARPCVYFTTTLSKDQDESIVETLENKKAANPSWAVSVSDLSEIKKVGGKFDPPFPTFSSKLSYFHEIWLTRLLVGLGWKAKIVVGWATDKEVKEGIELVTKDGQRYKVTALRERDELFNRLCSMGAQCWESY